MGQLVARLYARYVRELGDEKLAAIATQVRLAELMDERPAASPRAAAA